jgi:hypothetical protein
MKLTEIELLSRVIMFILYTTLLIASWYLVVNPIVGIWINKPYRDAVQKMFARLFKKNSVTPVVPLNQ